MPTELNCNRGVSRTLSNILDGAFCENSKWLLPAYDFRQKLHHIFNWVLERPLCNTMTMTQVVKCQKLPRNCLSVFDHFVGLTVNVAGNSLSKYQTFEQEVLRYLADACIISLPTLRYSILFTSWF